MMVRCTETCSSEDNYWRVTLAVLLCFQLCALVVVISLCSPVVVIILCSPVVVISLCSPVVVISLCSPVVVISLCSPVVVIILCSPAISSLFLLRICICFSLSYFTACTGNLINFMNNRPLLSIGWQCCFVLKMSRYHNAHPIDL